MNSIMRLNYLSIFLCALLHIPLSAAAAQSFLEKVEQIKKDIYKMSADELQLYLSTSFDPPPLITADSLKIAVEKTPDLFVINVLPTLLYDDCHIASSASAPLRELVDSAQSWERDRKIVVYCALDECDAGEKAYILLSCMGFTNITDYKGGIKEWFQLGYPTEGPAKFSYLHTKSIGLPEDMYPDVLVCSRQTRWIHKYQTK
jgi:rhodanese-related sulfurtransferase